MINYNPSIFDDKYTVLEQLEAVKDVLSDAAGAEEDNKKDITTLKAETEGLSTALSDLEGEVMQNAGDVSALNQQMSRTLKTPVSAPNAIKIVGIDTNNAQEMITIGDNLAVIDGTLNVIGGGSGGGGLSYGKAKLDISENTATFDRFWPHVPVVFVNINGGYPNAGVMIPGYSSSTPNYSTIGRYSDTSYYLIDEDGTCTFKNASDGSDFVPADYGYIVEAYWLNMEVIE